ncbi:MarR family transcriptional regulator [Candidatus Woesearchaeota archaeon]|nr:MarR family transcriptional regulator [Candidatus Woesearchaeota archaeon]
MISEERSSEDSKSVWSRYGLRESPFITSPTRLLGILPIDKVFSGREQETKRLVKILTSSNSTRTLILGDYGVGKTTFVNYVKWVLCLKHKGRSEFVTPPIEIKVQPEWDAHGFLLSTLSSVYNASLIFKWNDDGMKLPVIEKISEYVAIGTQVGIQGSFGGLGGGYSEAKSVPSSLAPDIYESLLTRLCLELRDAGKQLIVSYDNLENIPIEKLADFFRTIKDYLQIEGFHSIFIGPTTSLSALEKYSQVHSVFTQPIVLGSLNEDSVIDILKKRCEALKFADGRYIAPYDEETVRRLYRKLNNLRFTFKVLEDTTLYTEKKAPCKITIQEIRIVQEKEKQEVMSNLNNQETRIVSALLSVPEKINISELADLTKIGATNLTRPLKQLEQRGLVTITSSDADKRIKYAKISENSYLRYFFVSEEID